ncbi:hypothetical protein EVAR_91290_1 [Eumeta japonica]|uniref:Uncharacterized protein n=1 Tax=Eumeta variegata TaxID=151549 RepID=A0A4C2A423_EUMVA|nr:hypothetical protein EVAR_91290_1 [Eumeta japonica]
MCINALSVRLQRVLCNRDATIAKLSGASEYAVLHRVNKVFFVAEYIRPARSVQHREYRLCRSGSGAVLNLVIIGPLGPRAAAAVSTIWRSRC